MDINLGKRTQKVLVVVGASLGVAALGYFYYLEPKVKELKPLLAQDTVIRETLRNQPSSLYNTKDLEEQIKKVKVQIEELQSKADDNKPVVTDLTDKDIIVLLGNLTRPLGIDISNYKVVQDMGTSFDINATFIGHYQDLSLLFQALDHSQVSYGVNALEIKQVLPGSPLNQNNGLVYSWTEGKSTEVTNDLPLFIPSLLGILERRATSTSTTEKAPAVDENSSVSGVGGTSSASGNSLTSTNPEHPVTGSTSNPAVSNEKGASTGISSSVPASGNAPSQQTVGGNTQSSSSKEEPELSYDTMKVAHSDLRVQLKVDLTVSKQAVGLNLQNEHADLGRNNPWAYFVPESLKNYLGKSTGDFGNNGRSDVPFNINKLLSSREYVKSEINRTRSVIANRQSYGLDITKQLNYLYLLLFLDFREGSN